MHVCVCMWACVVCVCVLLCLCMCVCVCLCVRVHAGPVLGQWINFSKYSVHNTADIYLHHITLIYIYIYICLYMLMYIYIYIYMLILTQTSVYNMVSVCHGATNNEYSITQKFCYDNQHDIWLLIWNYDIIHSTL